MHARGRRIVNPRERRLCVAVLRRVRRCGYVEVGVGCLRSRQRLDRDADRAALAQHNLVAVVLDYVGHDCIGQNYLHCDLVVVVRNYIGHDYKGHNYVHHTCIGHITI